MNNPIQFKISHDKTTEVIIWLANMKPGIDIYHVAKVLFYADKMHINKYGRPITGDTYIRMPYGPVPSGLRDLITENSWLSPRQLNQIKNSLIIDKSDNHYKLAATREPDMNYFSKSDIICLKDSLSEYGEMSSDELYNSTHSEKCYYETAPDEKIDYALLIDDDNPAKNEILESMEEISQYIQV
ncbi:MAG: hypothetical protein DRI57_07435 [Deltaproteobacteria bacterium]|nr:MAG: hypothetical protein DRI57_07435 [Deltaproteobacteria bacterium]